MLKWIMVQRYSGLLSLFANYFPTKYLPFLFLLFALAFIQSYVSAFLNHCNNSCCPCSFIPSFFRYCLWFHRKIGICNIVFVDWRCWDFDLVKSIWFLMQWACAWTTKQTRVYLCTFPRLPEAIMFSLLVIGQNRNELGQPSETFCTLTWHPNTPLGPKKPKKPKQELPENGFSFRKCDENALFRPCHA